MRAMPAILLIETPAAAISESNNSRVTMAGYTNKIRPVSPSPTAASMRSLFIAPLNPLISGAGNRVSNGRKLLAIF